jgi:hypothetical protein
MKKSISLLSISLSTIFLFAFSVQAQHQRLGIAPQPTINLSAQNPSQEVEAFCLDRNRLIDGKYDYSHVLASDSRTVVTVGKRKLTLQKAIDEGLIKVSGQSSRVSDSGVMSLRFESLTKLPVKIEILESLAMGENQGRFDNTAVLASLRKPKLLGATRQPKQDEIWFANVDNARLEALGYTSVEEFQRANNLPLNGFDPITKGKLQEAENGLIARFEAAGIAESRTDTDVKSVADHIRKFQNATRAKATGVYSPDVRARFERYEKEFAIIKELRDYNANIENSLFFRVQSSIGDENLYKVYTHLGKLYEGNSISELNAMIAKLPAKFEKIYFDLDFPSPTKAEAFKTSFEIAQTASRVSFIEGSPASKNVLFSSKRTFEIDNVTLPRLENGEYSSTVNLKSTDVTEVNRNWKIIAASKLRPSVIKFTDSFRTLIGRREKLSLANIVERARAVDAARTGKLDVRVSFIDELGRIQLGKILFGKSIQITAE